MSRVLIGNLPPGTTIRNIDDFCSPFGRLLYVDVKNKGNATIACVEYENQRNALNLARARHGYNFNGFNVQLKLMDDSGPFEVRDDTRQQNQLPAWSNNQMFNNDMQGSSSYNYGGNNLGGNNFDNDCGPSSMDNSFDFNGTCRIVFDRFLQEGYNRPVAKEKTLEFVRNMQRGSSSSQGFNNLNSNLYGSDQDMNMNSNSGFGNFNTNDNQNWNGGNNYDNGDQQMFGNSNWGGNFKGPSDQQMHSAWGGRTGYNNNGGGMSYPMRNGNYSGRSARGGYRDDVPSSSRRNIGGTRRDIGSSNTKMGPNANGGGSGFQHDRYLQSLEVRKKIEARIKSGNKSVRDLKNLQFHNNIIKEYMRNNRLPSKKPDKKPDKKPEYNAPDDEQMKLQRYKSALGIVLKYKKQNQSQLSIEEKKIFISNKAIVDDYEKAIAKRNNKPNQTSSFERRKKELLKQSKLNYPYDFRLSGAAKKKMRSLTLAGIDVNEAKLLALHSSIVIQELIDMKKTIPKNVDRTKQLVPYKAGGGGPQKNASNTDKSKQSGVAAKTAGGGPSLSPADIMAKKLKAGYRSANKVLRKHEKSDIAKLTEKEKAIIRISLRRLRSYNLTEGKEIPITRFDVLLTESDKEKKPAAVKKEITKAAAKTVVKKVAVKAEAAVEEDAADEEVNDQEAEEEEVEAVEGEGDEEVEGDAEAEDEEAVEGEEAGDEEAGDEEVCEVEEGDEEMAEEEQEEEQ